MSYFRIRTGHWALRVLRRTMLWLAVMVMSCSLISMGGLIWVDNSWAIFPDDDPSTSFDSSLLFGIMTGEVDCDDLDPDGDGQIPLAGGTLLRGNGDQDDNKSDPLRLLVRTGAIVTPNHYYAPIKKWDYRATKSYLDFGHLKVFPDAPISVIISSKLYYQGQKAAAFYMRGGLLWFDVDLKQP